ncbi:hypothetical protein EV363DRAFT_1430224 [Boletus edulis]|nr:hypothetical protein EV363DRAFT_1430224 [Boletus edulis]
MGSADSGSQLPIISIAPYWDSQSANTTEREAVSKALHAACVEYGFFYLDISQCVDLAEPEELARLAREFFRSTPSYQRLKENVTNGKADNHEGIDIYRPVENPDKSRPLWGENQWPTVLGFQTKYEKWIEKMKKLGMILMEAMAYGLGMNAEEWRDLRAQVDDSFWVMRIIGYPSLPDDHDGFSCGAHKDYGCLTLLYADPTKSALQVFLRKRGHGGEEGLWINADPIPGCIVCNIGEMWEIWTNGLYKSTLHRVVHRGTNYRIPFFFEPNFTARVAPLPVAVRALAEKGDTPNEVYKPIVYGEFLMKKVGSNFSVDPVPGGKHD